MTARAKPGTARRVLDDAVRTPGWSDLWGGWHPTLRRAVAADLRNLWSTLRRRR